MEDIILKGVQEYNEQMDVRIGVTSDGKLVIKATNEGGHNMTEVDLLQLLQWLHQNRPDLMEAAKDL